MTKGKKRGSLVKVVVELGRRKNLEILYYLSIASESPSPGNLPSFPLSSNSRISPSLPFYLFWGFPGYGKGELIGAH